VDRDGRAAATYARYGGYDEAVVMLSTADERVSQLPGTD
jgi:hypothetical protein